MSNITKPILLDETGKQIAAQLAMIAKNTGGIEVTDWQMVQYLVRMGVASKVFHIGDQFTVNKGAQTLKFDVIGIDQDVPSDPQFSHSLTLGLHDVWDSVQFDANEAIYYSENALPAGTYYFNIPSSWGTALAGNYQITLTKDVPAGGQIGGIYRIADVAASGWQVSTYAKRSDTTPLETVAVTSGSSGTSLGQLKTAGDFDHNMNSIQRVGYGSNNWGESAIRQFLNSKAAAGSVWTPQTKWDRPPSWVTSLAGFMNGMDEDFLAVLQKAIKTTVRNTVCEDGATYTTEDTFFLPSRDELFMGPERGSSYAEGEAYAYYKNYSDYSTPNTGADSNRVKYKNGSAQWWWMRTPDAGGASTPRGVSSTGQCSYYYGYAYYSYGVAPACIIA